MLNVMLVLAIGALIVLAVYDIVMDVRDFIKEMKENKQERRKYD